MTTTHREPPVRWRMAALVACCLLTLVMSGCGSGAGGNATDGESLSPAQIEDARLDFAECMREHGVPMDDPQGGNFIARKRGEEGPDPDTLRQAEKACHHLMEKVLPDDVKDGLSAEEKEARIAAAQCMRERGWDMPDPEFGDLGVKQEIPPGVDPEDPQFQKDEAECAEESDLEQPDSEDEP